MVRSHDVVEDEGIFDMGHEPVADQEIIDPPADVVLPCPKALAPERVLDLIGMKMTERVGKPGIQEIL